MYFKDSIYTCTPYSNKRMIVTRHCRFELPFSKPDKTRQEKIPDTTGSAAHVTKMAQEQIQAFLSKRFKLNKSMPPAGEGYHHIDAQISRAGSGQCQLESRYEHILNVRRPIVSE